MTKKENDGESTRRDFLKLAGVAAPATAATLTGKAAEAADQDQQTGKGLRETAHTRAYFETARF